MTAAFSRRKLPFLKISYNILQIVLWGDIPYGLLLDIPRGFVVLILISRACALLKYKYSE